MKLTKRLAEERYCYMEIEFANLEEYNEKYPEFMKAYMKMQDTKEAIRTEKPPFEDPLGKEERERVNNNLNMFRK